MDTGFLPAGKGRSVWVVGDRYTLKVSGEETGGAFALLEALVPPGGGPPPHIHEIPEPTVVFDLVVAFRRSKMQDLNMLTCTEGRERTLEEYEILLTEAGFVIVRGCQTLSPLDAILAIRP